jgi:hypothetical protein
MHLHILLTACVPVRLLVCLPACLSACLPAVWAFVIGLDEQPLTAMQVLYVNLVSVQAVKPWRILGLLQRGRCGVVGAWRLVHGMAGVLWQVHCGAELCSHAPQMCCWRNEG